MLRSRDRSRGGSGGVAEPLAAWKLALASQTAGTLRPRLIAIGDSTTFGVGSNNGVGTDLKTNNYPTALKNLFVAGGRSAQAESFVGNGSTNVEYTVGSDPRVVASNWPRDTLTSNATLGGVNLRSNTALNNFAFTPSISVDTFKIWYPTDPTYGSLRSNIDGGTNTDTNQALAESFAGPLVLTTTLGTHTLNLTRTATLNAYYSSIEAYDSTQNQISVMTAGWPGARSTEYAQTGRAWSPSNIANYYQQDLSLVMVGINDWNGNGGAVSAAQYKINMQVLITKIKASGGSIAIVSPVPTANATTPLITQQTYVDKMKELAAENGALYIGVWEYFGSYETRQPQGWYNDTIHPSALGYSQLAQYIYDRIT